MLFDVLSKQVHFHRWQDRDTATSISFDVVPHGRDYLDIGEDYIIAAAGYLPMRDKGRTPAQAGVTITSDASNIEHSAVKQAACGYAKFFPRRDGDFDSQPAKLYITILVEPDRLRELLALPITHPGSAKVNVSIEGLEFGWEPDGSHQIMKLDGPQGDRRPIDSFSVSVEGFWTHERAIGEEDDRRTNLWLAQSPDETDRKTAAINEENARRPDPSLAIQNQCRSLLIVLCVLLGLLLLRMH